MSTTGAGLAKHRTRGVKRQGAGKSVKPVRTEKQKEDLATKGPLALLQEFVQSSKAYPLPANSSALQCTYDTRMASNSKANLEYRATIAFFLDGIPHHVAGGWHAAKKLAQRDTADRALRLLVGKWGGELMDFEPEEEEEASTMDFTADEDALLESFCKTQPMCESMEWSIQRVSTSDSRESQCIAVVELSLFGVPHKLAGAPQSTEKEARIDVAQRALWYMQCPGFEDLFEPEPVVSGSVPPVGKWLNDDCSHEAITEANSKTAVMRTQNRLQQTFSRQLQGAAVWEWNYEADSASVEEWPPIFRATVRIPVLGRSFSGDWIRGQREAQIDAIERVNGFLDQIS